MIDSTKKWVVRDSTTNRQVAGPFESKAAADKFISTQLNEGKKGQQHLLEAKELLLG